MQLSAYRGAANEPDSEIHDAPTAGDHERCQHPDHHDLGDIGGHQQRIVATDDQAGGGTIEDSVDPAVELEVRGGLGGAAPCREIGNGAVQ